MKLYEVTHFYALSVNDKLLMWWVGFQGRSISFPDTLLTLCQPGCGKTASHFQNTLLPQIPMPFFNMILGFFIQVN